jgi:hypothetical protein
MALLISGRSCILAAVVDTGHQKLVELVAVPLKLPLDRSTIREQFGQRGPMRPAVTTVVAAVRSSLTLQVTFQMLVTFQQTAKMVAGLDGWPLITARRLHTL